MKTFVFGHSSQGIPMIAHQFGTQGPQILILGGVHGNEPEGVVAATGLFEEFLKNYHLKLQITLVPIFNPEGVIRFERKNDRGVDLNRNLPTKDWTADVAEPKYNPGPEAASEPENKALIQWLSATKPKLVISLHSWKPMLNVNGDCHPEAEVIKKHLNYEIQEDIGYPTPGCLGTYCATDNNIPTLTYEIERGLETSRILQEHVPAILDALKTSERRFN